MPVLVGENFGLFCSDFPKLVATVLYRITTYQPNEFPVATRTFIQDFLTIV